MDYRIEQLRYQLREDPSSRVFYSLAEALRRQGEGGEAVALLRRGLEIHPKYAAAWVALGRTLRDLDDADGAGEAFGRALELDRSNLVAARAAGELAADRNDWVGAIEAYRLAENVLPGDPDIAGRIAAAEARMAEEAAEREVMAAPPPPPEVVRIADGDPFADEAGDEVQVGGPDDVFRETVEVAEIADEPVFEAPAAADEVEAPAAESWTDVTDEAGFETFGALQVPPPPDDESAGLDLEAVRGEETAAPESVPEVPEVPEVAEPVIEESPEPPVVPEPESWTDLDQELLAGADRESEQPAGVELIIPATLAAFDRPSGDPEDEPEAEPVQPDDVPLPTLTLARLAIQQGDHDLAEATLQSLVERDPSNAEAVKFLDSLRSRSRAGDGDTTSAKVAALRGWLDTIRLASERQRT